MMDLAPTIIAKSDQLNADDLVSGPMTITINRVTKGTSDQPFFFFYEGSGKKSFRPCKSMRRVIAEIWGQDAMRAVGKSMTVFRDAKVQYSGQEVGGVRISHMSHIDQPRSVSLITTRGRRGLYNVQPLIVDVQTPQDRGEYSAPRNNPAEDKAAEWTDRQISMIAAVNRIEDLEAGTSSDGFMKNLQRLEKSRPELADRLKAALGQRVEDLTTATETADQGEWA